MPPSPGTSSSKKLSFRGWGLIAASLIWLIFWISPGLHQLWNWLDVRIASLCFDLWRQDPQSQIILAMLNQRLIDLVPGLLLTGVFLAWIMAPSDPWLCRQRMVRICAFAVVTIASKLVFDVIISDGIGFNRLSPSLSLPDAPRLSRLVPIATKDRSFDSFPGDHAIVILAALWSLWRVAPRWVPLLLAILLLPFLPARIMIGAHWFSDAAVGSVSVVMFAAGLDLLLVQPWWMRVQRRNQGPHQDQDGLPAASAS